MTGATPDPDYAGGCDRVLTAVPSADVMPCSWTGDTRAEEVDAGIVALWQAYGRDRDAALRDRLLLHYAPLVKYVAGRVGTGLPSHVDVADLVQSGVFGLWDAIDRFEPDRGLKFETYAMQAASTTGGIASRTSCRRVARCPMRRRRGGSACIA